MDDLGSMRASEPGRRRVQVRVPRAHGRVAAIAALVAVALALWAASAAPSWAGSPGKWTNVTQETATSHSWAGIARDTSGNLQIVWTNDNASSIGSKTISPAGLVSGPSPLGDYAHVNDPAIVWDPVQAQFVVFASLTPDPAYPAGTQAGLYEWTSYLQNGQLAFLRSWSPLVGAESAVSGTQTGAALTPAGVFQTWCASGVHVHLGMAPGGDQLISADGDHSTLAYDGTRKRLFLLTARTLQGKKGLWLYAIDQTSGAASSSGVRLSRSATSYRGAQQFTERAMPVPAVGLVGRPGVVVAYPTGYPAATALRVWRIAAGGTATSVICSDDQRKTMVAVAADPKGRAWVVWAEPNKRRICARRSNIGATAWGATVYARYPLTDTGPWSLLASAQSDRLDVIAHFSHGLSDAFWHTQVLPLR
jgi:hypothetical protein